MAVKADITIDIDKQVGELQNLTQIYNARVGDNKTPLTIAWRKNDLPLNLKGLHAYIVGKTGDGSYNSETGKIDFPVNTPVSQFEDDGSGTLDGGQSGLTTLLIPKQMWQNSGLFAGYIGLKSEDGSVFTSKDIWFKVLGNVLDAGVEINYFIGDFDKALAEAEKKLQDKTDSFDQVTAKALEELQNNYQRIAQTAHDSATLSQQEIDVVRANAKDLAGQIETQRNFIESHAVVTKPQFDDLSHQITNSLSQINSTPEALPDAEKLKAKYPTGKDGIFVTADTGHMWIYYNNAWQDCGAYQSAGIIYKNGLVNLVGFPLVSRGQIFAKNIFDEENYTKEIAITVPQKFYVYSLNSDGSGEWKYTLLDNPQTTYNLDLYEYLVADISNKKLKIIKDGQIKSETKNSELLILGYNNHGNLEGPITSITETLSDFWKNSWQDFVSGDVTISNGTNNSTELLLTINNKHLNIYSYKKINYSVNIVDAYQLNNADNTLLIKNFGILALDLNDQILKVLDYTALKQETGANSYIVLGYNSYGRLIGMWSKYQDVNRKNAYVSNLYPSTGNKIVLSTVGDQVNCKWQNNNFKYIPTEVDSNKQHFLISTSTKNTSNAIDIKNQELLIFNIDKGIIETHTAEDLNSLSNKFIVLGFNANGKLVGNWAVFAQNDGETIPSYYHENGYIENKISKINKNNEISNGVSFFWLTDPHLKSNAMQSPKLLHYLQEQTGINLTFCGGDIPVAFGTQADVEWAAKEFVSKFSHATDNFFTVRGNHDFTAKKSTEEAVGFTESDAYTYNVLQRNNEFKLHSVPGKEYWYIDNPVQKVRYIGLDTTPVSDTSNTTSWGVKLSPDKKQADWLIKCLAEMPDDYKVITFSHLPLSNKLQCSDNSVQYLNQILISFANHRKSTVTVGSDTVEADFTKSSGKFIASFSGHTHLDEDGTDDGTLQINTYCDAMYNDDPNYKAKRTRNTVNEQCFDAVSIDFDKNTVKCVRIGAGAKEERDYTLPVIQGTKPTDGK